MRSLTPLERSFLSFEQPTTPQTIGCALLLDGEPDQLALHDLFNQAQEKFPRLSVVLAGKRWKEKKKETGFTVLDESSKPFTDVLGKLSLTPIDLTQNSWRAYLVRFGKNEWALVLQWHHAWSDGMGAAPLLSHFCGLEEKRLNKTPKKKSEVWSFRRAVSGMIALIDETCSARMKGGLSQSELMAPTGLGRKVLSQHFPATAIEALCKSTGSTAYEVFLSLFGAAWRKLLGDNAPAAVIVPVSNRRTRTESPLENCMIAASLPIPACPDFHQVMQGVKNEMARIRNTEKLAAYRTGIELFGRLPLKLQRGLWEQALNSTICICTSLGSFPNELKLLDRRITSLIATPAPVFHHAFAFSWLRYRDAYIASAVVDLSQVENIANMLENMREQMEVQRGSIQG